jgi:hypothetical protein
VQVADRRAVLLERAETMWMTAVEIERVTAELGERVPDSTVDAWRRRGQIQSAGTEPRRYLLGEVLGKVEARKTRRNDRKAS